FFRRCSAGQHRRTDHQRVRDADSSQYACRPHHRYRVDRSPKGSRIGPDQLHMPSSDGDRQGGIMETQGIAWHAVMLEEDQFADQKRLLAETFGVAPSVESEGLR
ncbi:hypothetical protein, partial [Nocardia xishanensis]